MSHHHSQDLDLVGLLRQRAEIETADGSIPIGQHLDYMAASEIERLRDNVSRLIEFIGQIKQSKAP
jgi:hypothetical protein